MDTIYQDNRIFVCIKPHGVLSTDEPGGLPSLVREALGEERACVRTVHRLDRVVGGLMVLARSRAAASILSAQVRDRGLGKEYLALAEGEIAPDAGTLTDYLHRDKAQRKTFAVPQPGPETQEARLDYSVLARKEGRTLVRIRLHTGRTHQIRAQFASRGWPLVGDGKYGAQEPGEGAIALWSWRLELDHPQTGERMTFCCPPPPEGPWAPFSGALEGLEKCASVLPFQTE